MLIKFEFGYLANQSWVQPFGGVFLLHIWKVFQIPLLVDLVAIGFGEFDLDFGTNDINGFWVVFPEFNEFVFVFELFKWYTRNYLVYNFTYEERLKLPTLILSNSRKPWLKHQNQKRESIKRKDQKFNKHPVDGSANPSASDLFVNKTWWNILFLYISNRMNVLRNLKFSNENGTPLQTNDDQNDVYTKRDNLYHLCHLSYGSLFWFLYFSIKSYKEQKQMSTSKEHHRTRYQNSLSFAYFVHNLSLCFIHI